MRSAGRHLGWLWTALCLLSARPGFADPTLPPLPEGPGYERLPVPGYLSAVVAWPAVARSPALPAAIAVHGSFDQPEWNCETYQQVVHGTAVLVCPRGKLRWDTPDEPSQRRFYFPAAGNGASASASLQREMNAALQALQSSFPGRVAKGPVLFIGFSQGAILGAPLLITEPARFPRAILVEGGHGAWNASSARQYARGGGRRILFACGRASCLNRAGAAAAHLTRAGVAARVVYAPDQGHTYAGRVAEQVAAAFDWVIAADGEPAARAQAK